MYAAKTVRDYLADELDDVTVCSNVPTARTGKLVTVTTAPTGTQSHPRFLSWRRIVLRCWADSETEAAELCEDCRNAVLASRSAGVGIRHVLVVGEPARFDDPDDQTPRFQLTVDVLTRV